MHDYDNASVAKSCFFQLIDLTSSKKLVAAVAEKPRWQSTLEQSVRN